MIIEMRTYDIQVGKLSEFIKIYDNDIRQIHTSILGNQIGFFYTEIGSLNQVIHLYGYDTYEDRERRRKQLSKNESFLKYLVKVKDLILSQTNQLLKPTDFSKIR